MFKWLRQRLQRARDEKAGRSLFEAAEGSYAARCAIVGIMMAIEADNVVKKRQELKPDEQDVFMMAYECCLLWAIKGGMATVFGVDEVNSALVSIHQHIVRHGYYREGTFENIWTQMKALMRIAMNQGPDGPPPYPVAEMVMAAQQARCPFDPMVAVDLKFGIYVTAMIGQMFEAAQLAAKEQLQGCLR